MPKKSHSRGGLDAPVMGHRATAPPDHPLTLSPSPLEGRLQLALALMTSLGSFSLGIGQEDLRLGMLAAVAAGTSVYFTDRKGWLVLNTTGTNLAGVAAMILTLRHWQQMEREVVFLALASLLVYLQCILHFRQKVPRVYWMLALLSFLQVVVAAVLTGSYVFAGLLVAYLFVALTALSLFLIYREQFEHQRRASAAADVLTIPDLLMTPLPGLIRRLFALGKRQRPEPSALSGPPRWPLAGCTTRLAARGSRRDGEADVPQGLWRLLLRLGLLTLLLAPLLFVAVPRTGQSQVGWKPVRRAGPSLTGFTENVTLDDVTSISESADEVMRVRFSKFEDGRRGEPYHVQHDVWLRGAVLELYDDGRWKRSEWYRRLERPILRRRAPSDADPVLQEITIEPLRNSRVLFGVAPVYPAPQQPRNQVHIDYYAEQLFRREELGNQSITYQMVSYGFKDGRQIPFRTDRPERPPYSRFVQRAYLVRPFFDPPLGRRTRQSHDDETQRARLTGLKAAADQFVGSQGLDPRQDPRQVALALERFLQEAGGFSYTLNPPSRNPALDPIEDFVVHNRQGHCEYFASALTLMLRSQGIPARMVVGYKGGEFNFMGEYYQVRQLNAHAWVEAWVSEGGQPGWLRLDPTPGSDMPDETLLTQVWQLGDYLDYLWSSYVLDMDPHLQRETVFEPLVAALRRLMDGEAWKEWHRDLGVGTAVVAVGLVVIALAVLLLAFVLYKLTVLMLRRLLRGEAFAAGGRRSAPKVEFYLRLERLLAQCGLHREATQTPQEFALFAAAELAADPDTLPVATLPARVVEAFYQVRFGGGALRETDMLQVEEALGRLEAAMRESKRRSNAS